MYANNYYNNNTGSNNDTDCLFFSILQLFLVSSWKHKKGKLREVGELFTRTKNTSNSTWGVRAYGCRAQDEYEGVTGNTGDEPVAQRYISASGNMGKKKKGKVCFGAYSVLSES